MIGFSAIPSSMTPELSNILLAINTIVVVVFLVVVNSPRIVAGSNRIARVFGLPALRKRFKLWFAAHRSH